MDWVSIAPVNPSLSDWHVSSGLTHVCDTVPVLVHIGLHKSSVTHTWYSHSPPVAHTDPGVISQSRQLLWREHEFSLPPLAVTGGPTELSMSVGAADGAPHTIGVGDDVGDVVCDAVGDIVGDIDGLSLGLVVGLVVGDVVGDIVGPIVGLVVVLVVSSVEGD